MFAYFDGDNIGSHLELLLQDDEIEKAREYSQAVNRALQQVAKLLEANPAVEVLVAGGDDLIARWTNCQVSIEEIRKICDSFEGTCGQSLSVGIGSSASRATYNLRRAKLMGRARIVHDAGSPGVKEA